MRPICFFGGEGTPVRNQHGKDDSDKNVHNEDQSYWQDSTKPYEEEVVLFGPETQSYIASASKIFWEKPLKEKDVETKMELGQIPSNCTYLKTKLCNSEIYAILGDRLRNQDRKLQDIQKFHAASTSLVIKAASEITQYLQASSQDSKALDIKTPLTMLKDALSLAGCTNQSINKIRRKLIKPSLPAEYSKLADIADDSAEFLFEDDIASSLENLQKENKTKNLLKKYRDSNTGGMKRSHSLTNYQFPSKTQKGTVERGPSYHKQNVRQKQNYNNNNNNSNYTFHNKQSSYSKKKDNRKGNSQLVVFIISIKLHLAFV